MASPPDAAIRPCGGRRVFYCGVFSLCGGRRAELPTSSAKEGGNATHALNCSLRGTGGRAASRRLVGGLDSGSMEDMHDSAMLACGTRRVC
jgi:hypothetical protein